MSVIFDYTAYLATSAQIAAGGYPVRDSETFVNPNAAVFLWALFNPGHLGTSGEIFLDTHVEWNCVTGAPASVLAYVWQIKASGGAWQTLDSGNATSVGGPPGVDEVINVALYSTDVLMPCEVQLIGTDADESWYVTHGSSSYICSMRAIGTV